VVMRGDFSKSRLGDLLKSAGDRTEALNGKEVHLASEIPMGSATFVPAYYLTATEWVLGDVATVRAAASAKNFQAGKVKGAAVAAMVAKPALALGLNMQALRTSWVGTMLGWDEAAKAVVGMFDELSLGMSEKEFKFTFRTQDQKIAAGALDIANGINEWMKMIPSLVKGAGFMLLGANTLVPEEMPDEVQGLFQDRKSFLQLVDAIASLVKASGSATLKGDRFDWRIQGTVGSAAVLGVLAGAAWFLTARSSEPEPYIERTPVYENPSDDENERVLEEPIPEEGSDLAPVPE